MTPIPSLSAFHLLILMGLTQAVFLAFMLAQRPRKEHGERWLVALLLLLAFEMGYVIYYEAGFYHVAPMLIGHDAATFLLYGPLLLFFMRAMAQEPLPSLRWRLLHFLPAILLQWNAFAYFFVNPERIDFIARLDDIRRADAPAEWDPLQLLQEILIGIYLVACWRVWLRYREKIEAERAQWQHSGLDWMRQVLLVFMLLWVLVLLRDQLLLWWSWDKRVDQLLSIVLPVTVFYLAYRLWQHIPPPLVLVASNDVTLKGEVIAMQADEQQKVSVPVVSDAAVAEDTAADDSVERTSKYLKSALDDDSAAHLFDALEALMQESGLQEPHLQEPAPWRDPELDLGTLAGRLEVSPHYLSQVINRCAQCNFYDYVNKRRVQAVQEALAAGAPDNVLDLAFAAGFNSKSAFYAAFKRHTGLTPRAFQQQISQKA